MIKRFLRYIFSKLKGMIVDPPLTSEQYCEMLRHKGVKVGKGTIIIDTNNIQIDATRPELLEIGQNVLLHRWTVIMTHDFASRCFVNSHQLFYPSHGKVKIGNNVWLGERVTICKGVTIGDNCIIGIGSVVTKSIPSNSVAVGVPAKVISSYENYIEKRSERYIEESLEYAVAIMQSGREPKIEDFYDDYPCFVDGKNYMDYDFPYRNIFTEEQFETWKKTHHKVFNSFDDFIQAAKRRFNSVY